MRRLAVLTCALCLVAPTALAAPAGGTWTGKLDKYTSKLHFKVQSGKLVKFTIPEAPAYCLDGFQAITVYVPSAKISGGKFARTYPVTYQGETEKINLSGHIGRSTAKGTVKLTGPCDGTFTWSAHH